jgi:hypothetical protein
VGRIALAVLVLVGLSVPAGLAATAPKWTAKGAITKLNTRAITVHGISCRITTASPARATLRLYYVGAEAKIACAGGVLRAIDVLKQLPTIVGKPTTGPPTTFQAVPGATLLTTVTSGSRAAELLGGTISITAAGNGSITAGGGTLALTCALGEGSPDIGGLQVGDRLTRMECRNGVLTALIRA